MTHRPHDSGLSWQLIVGPALYAALGCMLACALLGAAGATVAGRLAQHPSWSALLALAAVNLAFVLFQSGELIALARAVGHAEGRLRSLLARAGLRQPLTALSEQAVGELLDRVDDDPAQLAALVRQPIAQAIGAVLASVVSWVVAGVTWWPAWFAFPLVGAACVVLVLRGGPLVAARKAEEEAAWSEHGAWFEEAVAARDDVRTSLGQPYVLRQYAERTAEVFRRIGRTTWPASVLTARVGTLLNLLVAGVAVAGVWLVSGGRLELAQLVTLWFLVVAFVGALSNVTSQLPQIQSGLGAAARIRQLLGAEQEPHGGQHLPSGYPEVRWQGLDFAYPGGFGLHGVTLSIPAGSTLALVGRTGSGKSTMARTLSRVIDPPSGQVLVGGVDVTRIDLDELRAGVGVVGQRTEILAASLLENVTLFRAVPRATVAQAFAALGLSDWVDALPDGLDTVLGSHGSTLSAGEEQLVSFARLLVRDPVVVVLDEATARMDPVTSQRVSLAASRLMAGRTGLIIAHRLDTVRHADAVAVLDGGRLVQHGRWDELAGVEGHFRELLDARGSGAADGAASSSGEAVAGAVSGADATASAQPIRETPAEDLVAGPAGGRRARSPRGPGLALTVLRLCFSYKRWGLGGDMTWAVGSLLGAFGVVTGLLWGRMAAALGAGTVPWALALGLAAGVLISPWCQMVAVNTNPRWIAGMTFELRLAILTGQTAQHRGPRPAPAEVTARALDSTRLTNYANCWTGIFYGVVFAVVTAFAGSGWAAGALAAGVMLLSALISLAGTRTVGRAGREAADARAGFGRVLGSALGAAETIKLAGATEDVLERLRSADAVRVRAVVRENARGAFPWFASSLLVQGGIVVAWTLNVGGVWPLATALLLNTVLGNFSWYGGVAGEAVTTAPTARRWTRSAAELAGLDRMPGTQDGIDLVAGTAPGPDPVTEPAERFAALTVDALTVVHDDGTVGVREVSFEARPGELIAVVGRIGSGKSSLLAALAGLVDSAGGIRWNGAAPDDAETFLRPPRVAYAAQVPRMLAGTIRDNIELDHTSRAAGPALAAAQLDPDLAAMAHGDQELVGHRGLRLSGGQVQRLALARALAADAEVLVIDDISSALDPATEAMVWRRLRDGGRTVVASTSRRATLREADRVVVLEDGRAVSVGTWAELEHRFGALAD